MMATPKLAAGTRSSVLVDACQVCGTKALESVLFLGYLPPVNQLPRVGERPREQPAYPAELMFCPTCTLVQLGLVVDPKILFPPEYPYTSGVTRILHENFADLARESAARLGLRSGDLVIDVGSNDGTLLSKFQAQGQKVQGIEPTDAGKIAVAAGIPTETAFFGRAAAAKVRAQVGQAKVVTAANVFAHIEDVHTIVDGILDLLADDGVFISESHYLMSLMETVQYDTIYHEHLRHYSITSVRHLLAMHGLEVIFARRIPTHGGSIRVYAGRKGKFPVAPEVAAILAEEEQGGPLRDRLAEFRRRTVMSKLDLYAMLRDRKAKGHRIYGISAPSRASTLVTYVGLNRDIIDCVLELPGSYKVGKYMPGTLIPIEDESRMFSDPPDVAVLFSWHIADELMPKLRKKGYRGDFVIPLPEPRLVRG